jgi:hypothetical protein
MACSADRRSSTSPGRWALLPYTTIQSSRLRSEGSREEALEPGGVQVLVQAALRQAWVLDQR